MASGTLVALSASLAIHISKGFIYAAILFIIFFFGLLANRSIMTLILQRRFIVVYLHYTLLQALNLPRLLRYCGAPQLVGKQAKGIFFLAASC